MARSKHEALFELHLRAEGIDGYITEHQFHPKRRWRFDFALPSKRVAVEIEGGIWRNGRHNQGKGFQQDAEKYNAASLLGWRVLRFTPAMVKSGEAIALLKVALWTA